MTASPNRQRSNEATALVPATPLVRIADVCRWLKISKPTFWRLRREADFPTPIAITERVIGWPREEIQAWLDARRRSQVNSGPLKSNDPDSRRP